MRILVVDDESAIRLLISQMLAILRHEAVTAANGLEAVRLFAMDKEGIDVVVTDLHMPVMDGYEAVRQIRKTAPDATIIAMSGYAESECPAGTTFLEKPFTLASVQAAIARALSNADQFKKAG
jgi:CheY-like chemotaxis protein